MSPGSTADERLRRQMAANQTRAEMHWRDTTADMLVGDMVRERSRLRDTRRSLTALAVLAVLLLLVGLASTVAGVRHDELISHEQAAAQATPYQPFALR